MARRKSRSFTEVELEFMRILWERGELSPDAIKDELVAAAAPFPAAPYGTCSPSCGKRDMYHGEKTENFHLSDRKSEKTRPASSWRAILWKPSSPVRVAPLLPRSWSAGDSPSRRAGRNRAPHQRAEREGTVMIGYERDTSSGRGGVRGAPHPSVHSLAVHHTAPRRGGARFSPPTPERNRPPHSLDRGDPCDPSPAAAHNGSRSARRSPSGDCGRAVIHYSFGCNASDSRQGCRIRSRIVTRHAAFRFITVAAGIHPRLSLGARTGGVSPHRFRAASLDTHRTVPHPKVDHPRRSVARSPCAGDLRKSRGAARHYP